MDVLIGLGATIGITVVVGIPLCLIYAYLSCFDPVDDLKRVISRIISRIRKRSWE